MDIGTNSACCYYWVKCLRLDAWWRDMQHKHCIYSHDLLKLSGNTLDPVITNEEHMINDILYLPGFGLSDHVCLQFK